MKWLLFLVILLSACGGGTEVDVVDVVPHSVLQHTSSGEAIQVVPYHATSLPTLLDVQMVYIADELFWTGSAIQVGFQEQEILQMANEVHSSKKKVVVSILPEVLASPLVSFADINAFDIIGVDVYPANYTDSNYTHRLLVSVEKLRKLGFDGEIWYIYQAFGTMTAAQATAQAETIRIAPLLGITGLVAYKL